MSFTINDIQYIIDLAKEARIKILEIYNQNFDIIIKSDNSPVTEADLITSQFIEYKLSSFGYPILSEENADISFEERSKWDTYWLIDPIDGTKEFVNKTDEFTINIALVVNNKPVFGLIYIPVTDITYYGMKDCGSYKLDSEGNITSLSCRKFDTTKCTILSGRNSFFDRSKVFELHLKSLGVKTEFKDVGSSIKMCWIAEGIADVYPRLGPTSEWDTAAAQIILEEAGGTLINQDSFEPLTYNLKESYTNPNFFAFSNSFPVDYLNFKIDN